MILHGDGLGAGRPQCAHGTGLRFQARADASDRSRLEDQGRPHWDFAAELLLRAAETGKRRDVEAATAQMERALRVEGWL
jgi:hypothetical protein